MLGRLSALLLGSILAITNNVNANPMVMPIILQCESEGGKMLSMVQEQYGEIPFFTAKGLFQGPDGKWNESILISTVNPSNNNFSLVMVDPVSGAECLLMAGSELRPAQ